MRSALMAAALLSVAAPAFAQQPLDAELRAALASKQPGPLGACFQDKASPVLAALATGKWRWAFTPYHQGDDRAAGRVVLTREGKEDRRYDMALVRRGSRWLFAETLDLTHQ